MKKTLMAAALTLPASAALAHPEAVVAPQMDVEVITQDMAGAAADSWVVPGIFALILILVLSGGGVVDT